MLTGHTGFKGSWTALWLTQMGADVTGFALPPETEPNPFALIGSGATSVLGDLRDADRVDQTVADAAPEIVIHMAAQPLVRRSYRDPRETFGSNVMGTVNLLDALTTCQSVHTILVVTSDWVSMRRAEAPRSASLAAASPMAPRSATLPSAWTR